MHWCGGDLEPSNRTKTYIGLPSMYSKLLLSLKSHKINKVHPRKKVLGEYKFVYKQCVYKQCVYKQYVYKQYVYKQCVINNVFTNNVFTNNVFTNNV